LKGLSRQYHPRGWGWLFPAGQGFPGVELAKESSARAARGAPACKLHAGRLLVVFVLDNYDSFTYNLVQYLGELGAKVEVRRNDQVSVGAVEAMQPERIVISPGPCTPQDAGISIALIRHFAGKVPVLGVCLGHQAIGAAFGGNVVRAPHLMHGKTSAVTHDGKTIFHGLPTPMTATRYHSLIVEEKDLPDELEVSAWTTEKDGSRTIMGLRHRNFAVEGVQFHPESVLTNAGKKLVGNFLGVVTDP
jgi:anthranilate synthase/aminodeoxychorismate synthase-like glutamine amidotransferase